MKQDDETLRKSRIMEDRDDFWGEAIHVLGSCWYSLQSRKHGDLDPTRRHQGAVTVERDCSSLASTRARVMGLG